MNKNLMEKIYAELAGENLVYPAGDGVFLRVTWDNEAENLEKAIESAELSFRRAAPGNAYRSPAGEHYFIVGIEDDDFGDASNLEASDNWLNNSAGWLSSEIEDVISASLEEREEA